jgi:hypothetical protein
MFNIKYNRGGARKLETMESGFSRYFADQLSWLLYQLECFGLANNDLAKPQMIF